ncbi:hypothetical protein J4732_06695, partial [Serratia marcescens]|nr:hypothetical protein [Serratia marcescens]
MYRGFESLTAKFKKKAGFASGFFAGAPPKGEKLSVHKTPVLTANGGPQGGAANLTAKFKEKAPDSRPCFFAWCTAEGRPRQGSTSAFWTANGGPASERSESSPSHRQIQRKHGFASSFTWCTDERAASFPLCDSDLHYRRLSTNFTADFLTHSWHVPCRSRSFQQSAHGLSGRTKHRNYSDRIG